MSLCCSWLGKWFVTWPWRDTRCQKGDGEERKLSQESHLFEIITITGTEPSTIKLENRVGLCEHLHLFLRQPSSEDFMHSLTHPLAAWKHSISATQTQINYLELLLLQLLRFKNPTALTIPLVLPFLSSRSCRHVYFPTIWKCVFYFKPILPSTPSCLPT